ncbi:LacI family transcriptional regulator [Ktedonosporobacter rubrisoli]|uniref:LacI family transcriptional regulator n=1 Tax=Ktedonosporobacter rubrisoli TaxID=2509675 RepID=A0A4P6JHY6_KTERU|nr:LacI family DNA-binding transcriptional regulator [Ktedonosporobacter rubrisoli]QBD74657.1 LacI family transcriptional regulator [Ktedonosporobacter rubrisoli]
MATSRQVAQLAGVSRATVSRVLNGSPRISAEARDRVHAAMKALGYEPDVVAQNLARQRSYMIALGLYHEGEELAISTLSRTENYYYLDMIKYIDRGVAAAGYDLFLPSLAQNKAPENYIRSLRARRIAGTIMLALDLADVRIQALLQSAIPTVFIDTRGQGEHATYVDSNHMDGARQVTEHLLSLGHRRIAIVTGPLTDPASTERLLGFQQTLAHAGIALDPGLLCLTGWNTDEAYRATRTFLEQRHDFTAIIAGSDMMALGILRALHERGLRVPQDVSLTGFDDLAISQYIVPSLTTVKADRETMSKGAVQRLMALVEGEDAVPPLIVPSQLIIRESTGPAPSPSMQEK